MIYNSHNNFYNVIKYKFFIFIIFIILLVFFLKNKIIDFINIPELFDYKVQELKILIPKKKCHSCKITLFFVSKFRDGNTSNELDIKQIYLKDKNYFVTYYVDNPNYFIYNTFFREHGLIRSNYIYGKNNIFINLNNIFKREQQSCNHLSEFQKVYQYISGDFIFKKDSLYKEYKSLKKKFNDDFNYMPETFNYPEDKDLILNKFSKYRLDIDNLWLIKPTNKWAGEGIKFLNSIKSITYKEYIITKYLKNIALINGKKYDLRLYVLISGLKPLRIYFYKEGLVRIASEKYSITPNNIRNKYIHLTNTDVNKNNKKYVHPNNSSDENANMWNIFMYKKYLKEKHNIEWNYILVKIKDIIIKTIISLQQNIIKDNDKRNVSDTSFYNLLGFDILLTDEFIPILLEVNHSPAMFIYNNLQRTIKNNLLTDTLNLVGITPFSRKKNKPLYSPLFNINDKEINIKEALCELNRPRGDYELIFPLKSNIDIYNKYFINNSKENIQFWNKIKIN